MKLEGLTDDEILPNCSYVTELGTQIVIGTNVGTLTQWSYSKACVLTVLLNKLAKDNWELVSVMEYDEGIPECIVYSIAGSRLIWFNYQTYQI